MDIGKAIYSLDHESTDFPMTIVTKKCFNIFVAFSKTSDITRFL